MNENELGREPIELVEIVLPRCINTYGFSPCTATGAAGSECYNCRATCQDPNNYRDTPDRHLTPDVIKTQGETILASELDLTSSFFAAFDVRFGPEPEGIIWEQGNDQYGAYIGVVTNQVQIFISGLNYQAAAQFSVTQFVNKTITFYVDYSFTPNNPGTIRTWFFDDVSKELIFLSEDPTAGAGGFSTWADSDPGAIGRSEGEFDIASRPDTPWNGDVIEARFYSNTLAPTDIEAVYGTSLWLGRGVKGEPTDELYILPCLQDLGAIGTRINISGADDNYQPLGRRATLDFTCSDFAHSDITQDPYLSTRLKDPSKQSTFWRKWLERQKFAKVGALVRVHDGYAGQSISEYKTRSYIVDKVDYNEDAVSFHCRDVLSRTEFRRSQAPQTSTGILSLDVTNAQTTIDLSGDVTQDYPSSGTVRINDEIFTYTSTSYSAVGDQTTFSGLARGTDGSSADEHDAGDLVQLCRRYTGASIDDVVTEFLFSDSELPAQLVDVDELTSEVATYLDSYRLTTLITEPTGVDTLLGQISQDCSFYIWWDERVQKIRTKAIRAISDPDIVAEWTYESNIVSGSMKLMEKPKQRLNVITFYYNPIDFTSDLDKPSEFKNALKVINGTTSLPEQYGDYVQTREIFSRWLTTEAVVNQTSSRLSVRYADVPKFAEFYVDAKDRSVWTGDIVRISHPMIVDINGDRVTKRWLVIEAEEVDPGHLIRYVCADITLDGVIYLITENSVTTYSAELFEQGNAFITDEFGLNPDGTTGATVS